MNDRPEDAGMPGAEPPMAPPPPPPPPVPGTVTLESETPVRAGGLGGLGGRIAAGAVGLVLLVGGVAFAATQIGSESGADDPTAAVEDMFAAIGEEDVLGLLATLDPGERDALSGPVKGLFEQLERLEVLHESFELDGVAGIDLEFSDLRFEEEAIRSDLVRVYLTGGTASFAVDTDKIPVGKFLTDTFDRFGVEYRGIQQQETETLDPAEAGETFVVARRTGDGWRVSLGYTAVEVARMRTGAQVPVAGAGLKPIGADTPEGAVEGLLEAAVAIDVEGVVARLSPGELGAVHDYWPALVGQTDLPDADDVPADITLTDLELRSTTDGRRGRVFIDSIGIDVVAEDFSGGATIADGCIEVRGDVRSTFEQEGFELPDGPICQDDIEAILQEATGQMGTGIDGFGSLEAFGAGETPNLGITVVEVDQRWFVAPFGTYADLGLAMLGTVDRQDLDDMVDAIEGFFGGGFFGGGMIGGGFVPPGMTGDLDDGFSFGEVETETFSEVGEPIDPPTATDTDAVLDELLGYLTGDPEVAKCALGELYASARPDQLEELADGFRLGIEPAPETQDLLYTAMSTCGW